MRARAERRLATVLFVDIVDSTRIAAEVGDGRWRELLGRSAPRFDCSCVASAVARSTPPATASSRRSIGQPMPCAAREIVAEVQESGIDVRCGIHAGELERIDGRLGGIAAHIGARVMSHAGPAQVLVTGTVRGPVAAPPPDTAGEKELKGVPGVWALHRLLDVDGRAAAAIDPGSHRQGVLSRRTAAWAAGRDPRGGRRSAVRRGGHPDAGRAAGCCRRVIHRPSASPERRSH